MCFAPAWRNVGWRSDAGCSSYLLAACSVVQSLSGAWLRICRFDEEGGRWLAIPGLPFVLHAPKCICFSSQPSSSSLYQVRPRCIPDIALLGVPENHCPDPKWDVKVEKRKRKREENISPSGNLPINTPDTKVSMELFPSKAAKMSLTDGKSKNKRVLRKQLKDVENEKQQRM